MICFSSAAFVSKSRRAIILYSSLKRWLGTGTEIANVISRRVTQGDAGRAHAR